MWQEVNNDLPIEIPVRVRFASGRRRVRGTAEHELPNMPPVKLDFRGGFVFDHYIELEYTNEGTWQRGAFIAQLDSSGKTLNGTFAGFGLESNKPVHGTAKLTKA
jgi:hypothetical protein